jgi:hypothetical protein
MRFERSDLLPSAAFMSDDAERSPDDPQPIHGQIRYTQVSARIPDHIKDGCFASAVMVMTGPFETVLDFILRLSEQPRVVARVVLPPVVVGQFIQALQKNIGLYESNFGPLPRPPMMSAPTSASAPQAPEQSPAETEAGAQEAGLGGGGAASPPWTTHPSDPELREPGSAPTPASIEQIYEELRLPDSLLSGRYANAVLIRHSSTEFCFDFITNIFPRSAVSSRVYLAAANVAGLLQSLQRSQSNRPR